MNQAPHIEPDAAFKRRVQVFPFRAVFDEMQHPGCVALAMERKKAPLALRQYPDRLSQMLREEIENVVLRTYELLGCRDWSRIDVRLDSRGRANIIEVNPLPGILPNPEENSCYPKAARAAVLRARSPSTCSAVLARFPLLRCC